MASQHVSYTEQTKTLYCWNARQHQQHDQYNVLNLPTGVTFASGGFIQHGYTADGIKRRMMYKEADGSGNPVPTVYCCNVVYENGVARLLLTEEGYVTLSDKKYHYYLQDHQGTTALSSVPAVLLRKRLLSFWWGICKLRQCAALQVQRQGA